MFSLPHLQKLLLQIPKGKVVTYAELARALGNPKAARAAGTLCGKNPEPYKYPCCKVVHSDGSIGKFALGTPEKIKMLEAEGIEIKKGKIQNFAARKYSFSR